MNIKISCVIPLYNSEKYIERCLDSVLQQTFKDFEVIIVNDGSTDKSFEIASKYIGLDPRIKIISQENQGLSISRNNGTKIAKGDYIFYLDSDDEITKDAFSSVYNRMMENKVDILIFNYAKVYSNRSSIKRQKLQERVVYSTLVDKKKILSTSVMPSNKLYSRDFLIKKNIFFYPNIYYEDVPFLWKSAIPAESIAFLDKNILLYHQNHNSIINSDYTEKKINDIIKAMLVIREVILEYNVYYIYKDIYEIKTIKTFIDFFYNIKNNKKKTYVKMRENIKFINIKEYKGKISIYKYIKYKLFLDGNYIVYRLFFNWF